MKYYLDNQFGKDGDLRSFGKAAERDRYFVGGWSSGDDTRIYLSRRALKKLGKLIKKALKEDK